MRALAAVLAVLAVELAGAATAAAAPPPGACTNADPGRPEVTAQPWAQQLLDPERAWPYSRGTGVLVAVVDSGVDADHPQLHRPGKVLPGHDFVLPATGRADFDCVSHGTGVAGLIAADPVPGIGFHGIAPDATILPVRISDRDVSDQGQTVRLDPHVLAEGIRYAADAGAKVINLSLAGYDDFPEVRDAVAHAVAKDALVVAAAGNTQRDQTTELPSYPADYPGVLGVGAIDIDGARMSGSQLGPYVRISAPGVKVLATTRSAGHSYVDGTSFAAPLVAGTAALVRSAWPGLSAAQVAQRLIATADPARGGRDSHGYGAGIVDPYRAVTDGLDTARYGPLGPAALPAFSPPPPDPERQAAAARQRHDTAVARWSTVAVAAALLLALGVALVLPRGRRRRWRPALAAELPAAPASIEPPEQVFLVSEP